MRETVNKLRAQGKKVGLVKARSFRPFPDEEIAEALKNVKSFAVMDKDDSFIHNAFEDVGATMFGAETAYKVMKKRGKIDETWKLITFDGDGGTSPGGFRRYPSEKLLKVTKTAAAWVWPLYEVVE